MVAYMNKESLKITLREKQTCFYSRSRKVLWTKGKTSGSIQKVKKIYYDCDKDALLIKVAQKGVACHTGEWSCFFKKPHFSILLLSGLEVKKETSFTFYFWFCPFSYRHGRYSVPIGALQCPAGLALRSLYLSFFLEFPLPQPYRFSGRRQDQSELCHLL